MRRALDIRALMAGGALVIIPVLCLIFSGDVKVSLRHQKPINRVTKTTDEYLGDSPKKGTASPILYVHFHKAGGTSVCNTMKKIGYNMTDMMGNDRNDARDINCNVEISGPMNDIDLYHSMQTCRLLETYTMNEKGVPFARDNFLAVEVPFHEAMPCEGGFRSFAVMRDPVERLVSHLNVHDRKAEDVVKWIRKKQPCKNGNYVNGYPTLNSMVIRQLLGRERYLDTRPIDEKDLEEAKKRVDAFDAFVPLEYLQHEKTLNLLKRTIPEYYEGLQREHVAANVNKKKKTDRYSKELMKQLVDENKYDAMLYKYMLQKLGIE